jgi:hypothetical protein
MGNEKKLFMVGQISNSLYPLDIKPIIQPDAAPNSLPPILAFKHMAEDPGSAMANLVPLSLVLPSINLAPESSMHAGGNPLSFPDPGIFAVLSLASMY